MAENLDQSSLSPDSDANQAPRIRLGEIGYTGIKVLQKQILEETDKALRMPNLIKTVDEMKRDSAISAALEFYKMVLGSVDWSVKAPVKADAKQKERAKFIASCMNDMDQSWFAFIQSVLSVIDYGFAVNEIVFKRRRKENSKFDDGLVGWAKLPSRAQSTIVGWIFSEDGRELQGLEQSLANLQYKERYSDLAKTGSKIEIERRKFLLFRTSPLNDNPEGSAALKSAYRAWRYKKAIEEQELIGIGRDLGGLFSLKLPARYMSETASAAEKSVYEEYKKVGRNISNGEQSCVITPSDTDPDSKKSLFEAELLTSQGAKAYDTNLIVQRYTSQMLICLFADLLQLGNNATGSFALAGSKADVIEYALKHKLHEIKDVINTHLIPLTFKMNGWSDTEYPEITFGEIGKISLDEMGKFVQRVTAVGAIEVDRQVLNMTRTAIGCDPYSEDEEPNAEYLPEKTSRSGDGLSKGSGNGTSDNVAGQDNSANNNDNAR